MSRTNLDAMASEIYGHVVDLQDGGDMAGFRLQGHILAVLRRLESETREACAKVAEAQRAEGLFADTTPTLKRSHNAACERVAAAIRAKPIPIQLDLATVERRADGWPLCPRCGEDELAAVGPAVTKSEANIDFCYRCAAEVVTS